MDLVPLHLAAEVGRQVTAQVAGHVHGLPADFARVAREKLTVSTSARWRAASAAQVAQRGSPPRRNSV